MSDFLRELGILVGNENLTPMPSESLSFDANSLVAPWMGALLYHFLTDDDIAELIEEERITTPHLTNMMGDGPWTNVYYVNYDECKAAMEVTGADVNKKEGGKPYKPTLCWVMWCKTADVLNIANMESFTAGFGVQIVKDVKVQDIRTGNKKGFKLVNRHAWGLLALPSAVAAIAKAIGFENAGFELQELTTARDEGVWTDEMFELYCGDLQGKCDDSMFGQRRAELWASLGEPKWTQSAVIGSLTAQGNKSNRCTESVKLSKCLEFVQGKWSKPVYCRVTAVNNPLPEEVSPEGKRRTIPCVTEVFANKDAALAACADELSSEDDGSPAYPEGWEQYKTTWVEKVTEYQIVAGLPPIQEADAQEVLGASMAAVREWKEYLGL